MHTQSFLQFEFGWNVSVIVFFLACFGAVSQPSPPLPTVQPLPTHRLVWIGGRGRKVGGEMVVFLFGALAPQNYSFVLTWITSIFFATEKRLILPFFSPSFMLLPKGVISHI